MVLTRVLIAVILATVTVAGCSSGEPDHAIQKDALVKSVTIPVEGMACDSCANRIKKNLTRIDGVLEANVSFDDKYAVIHYDARKLEPKRLASAISGLGFKAGTPVEAVP